MSIRWCVAAVFLAGAAGCEGYRSAATYPSLPTTRDSLQTPTSSSLATSIPEPIIEISDAATAQLLSINQDYKPGTIWRLRMEFTPEGCTGIKTHLSIDTNSPGRRDATCQFGNVNCVYLKDQFPLVQGALVDWVQNDKETGFKVDFPHKTKVNQEKTSKWITDEYEKWKERNKQPSQE
jgi:Fe-S cluster assembly iron-binding protein IscA